MDNASADDVALQAVEALRQRDEAAFARAAEALTALDDGVAIGSLLAIITEAAGERSIADLPAEDALGEPRLHEVMTVLQANDIAALLALLGNDYGRVVGGLIAVAAQLR
ncbi:MAG: hypothetical protein QM597_00985 [Aeromicrobium sp.]|uniref:hypothetical protein n=1 Tax=Aeromicrobium sp. TaxID=1871063 RepID=UPI0039E471B4